MSGYRVFDTLYRSDIEALFDVGAHVALVGDGSSFANGAKEFRLELNLDISNEQITMLRSLHNLTHIKLSPSLMFGGGRVGLQVYYYDQDVLQILGGRAQYRPSRQSLGYVYNA